MLNGAPNRRGKPSVKTLVLQNNTSFTYLSCQDSGEAILGAENSGKPLGGRGSALNPAGGTRSAPQTPYMVGRGLLPLPQEPYPALSAFGPLSSNEQSWARP